MDMRSIHRTLANGTLAVAALFASGTLAQQVATPPQADALETTERSVVRIITLSFGSDGQISGVAEGSGFVVAPGRVVTNNHVVAGDPNAADVRVFVIPERDAGVRGSPAGVIASWREADLSLLNAPRLTAPPLSVTSSIPAKDSTVHALGYPGITDEMRGLPVAQILAPAEPYVTPGSIALLSHTAPGGGVYDTIFHTAPINPGNSGGPLVDQCGRVIGVNAWMGASAVNSNGQVSTAQGQFAAIQSDVLAGFLTSQNVALTVDPSVCTPPMDATVAARLIAAETAIASEAKQRADAETALQARDVRDRRILIGIVAMIVLAGVGMVSLVLLRKRSEPPAQSPTGAPGGTSADTNADPIVSSVARAPTGRSFGAPAVVALVVGVAILAVAGTAYVLAPNLAPPSAPNPSTNSATPPLAPISPTSVASVPEPAAGSDNAHRGNFRDLPPARVPQVRASCAMAPEQSFNASPDMQTTAFSIDPSAACVNGRTPYERSPEGFSRVMSNSTASVVSTLAISADMTTFRRRDYQLSTEEYAALMASVGATRPPRCGLDDTPQSVGVARAWLAALRAASQPYIAREPIRQITWRCATLPGR